MEKTLRVGVAQIAPIWLNRVATTDKLIAYMEQAASANCELLCFGETILPGYPFWLSLTHGSRFNDQVQKEINAYYIEQAVQIERGDLDAICKRAAELKMAIYLGVLERPKQRGGHSVYCSLVYINQDGKISSVHRKLQPTYEERLTWAQGDGHGLVVHPLKAFTLGGLNCWENWMPLSRTALYAQGENLHVAVWPGAVRNTEGLTRYIAEESRSYVISACGLMQRKDIGEEIPHADQIISAAPEMISDGGSCIAGPDGKWLIEPLANEEALLTAELHFDRVLEERQNFDPAGHYSRPDVTRLVVNRDRQSILSLDGE